MLLEMMTEIGRGVWFFWLGMFLFVSKHLGGGSCVTRESDSREKKCIRTRPVSIKFILRRRMEWHIRRLESIEKKTGRIS